MEDGGWNCRNFDFGLWALDFGRLLNPRFNVLLEIFLRLEIGRDEDYWAVRKQLPEQCCEKRLGGRANPVARQRTSILQAPGEGLRGGSFYDVSEHCACR